MVLAGLINALEVTGKKASEVKLVMNGAGSSGQACMKLAHSYGFDPENCIMCDTRGVIYSGREAGMDPTKALFERKTDDLKTLADAFKGADIAIGLS